MEFKKPTRHNQRQPQRGPSLRGEPLRAHPRPAPPVAVAPRITETFEKPAPKPRRTSRFAAILSFANRHISVKKAAVFGVIVAIIGAVTIGPLFRHAPAAKNRNVTVAERADSPSYTTVLPASKSIGELGGWKRISPPKSEPVYAYFDKINGVLASISEQPLPQSFQGSTDDKVAELAKGYNATDKINANGTTVYIGTSSKGTQSVIFTKKDLLVLIKSQKKIDTKTWASYVSSLN